MPPAGSCTHDAAAQEEVVLVHVELARRLQDLGAHVEGEEQLVALEQTAARVPETHRPRHVYLKPTHRGTCTSRTTVADGVVA